MKKITLSVIAIVAICIAGYVVLGYTGYVSTPLNATTLYPNIQEIDAIPLIDFIDDDIERIQSILSGLSDKLDIHVYGINDQSAFSVISWYEQTNIQNG